MSKSKQLSQKDAQEAFKKVEDPELFIDIYTLNLIRDVQIKEDNTIHVDMTLTSPMCPYGPMIVAQTSEELSLKGFKDPEINLVFDPPWEPTDEIKMMLGLM